MFLYLRPVQRFLFFLTFMLALSFNYLDVVILGKAALSIIVCLPSKQSLLPPYLCELIKISSFNYSLPLFSISSPSQLTSLSLFSARLSTLTPTLSPFWNNKLFPLSFPVREDVFGPTPKIFGMKPYSCHSAFPLGTFPEVFHRPGALGLHTRLGLALSIMLLTIQHSRQAVIVVTGLVSLALSVNLLLFSYHFQKVCLRYKILNFFLL
uniref:Uncharacterized protein n=1 Tax=Rousettus aegyptiacus TaxID=9407 RepID=A0A7J8F0L0_ROUAE|nr:hypothetical protein HJG63_012343 [Rousettus aegyptiacus]